MSLCCFALGLTFAALLGAAAVATATPETSAAPAAHVCGPLGSGHEMLEPPTVAMWKAPVDARGEHELVLAVHADGDRYCYRYVWNGVEQTNAPAIHVRRGERFAIRIVNDISGPAKGESVAATALPPCEPMTMPDVPVAHWVGYLNHVIDDRPVPNVATDTNLHLHGFEGPASMEDVFLSTLSTPMHACEFDITVPATQPPGTYAYHPHAHGGSDIEVAGGLDGAWIVEPDAPMLPPSAQHVLIVRYRLPFEDDNKFAPPNDLTLVPLAKKHEAAMLPASPAPYNPFDPPPWPLSVPMRGGNVALDPTGCNGGMISDAVLAVNGAEVPTSLNLPAGQTQLLRLVNGTSDSSKLFALHDRDGHPVAFHVASLDGIPISGNMERPLARYLSLEKVMLTPMSRADIVLTMPPGQTYTLSDEHFCGGADGAAEFHQALVRIRAVPGSDAGTTLASQPEAAAQTPAAKLTAFARAHPALVRKRAIAFTEYIFPKTAEAHAHQAYYITDITNSNFHEHPFWPSYRPGSNVPAHADVVVKQGTIEEWYLINTTMEAHGFHIHQMAFVDEHSQMGVPVTVDTTFVPVGTLLPNPRDPDYPLVKPSITKVLLDFRHVPKGTFVFHCHMLYHEDHGMMGIVRVT